MSSEKKHLTLFFITVFLYFLFIQKKSFSLCFTSMHEQLLFLFWQSSYTWTWIPFTAVSMLIAHATLVHRSTSMYQWPCPFRKKSPISTLPCCTVLITISPRVIGLRSLESDVFYNSLPAENCKHFLHQRHVLYK